MTEQTRRMFLGGMLSGMFVVAAGESVADVPTIYADGVRDDSDGIEAFISGKSFRVDNIRVIYADGAVLDGSGNPGHMLMFRRPVEATVPLGRSLIIRNIKIKAGFRLNSGQGLLTIRTLTAS